jgi:hypothetical protein
MITATKADDYRSLETECLRYAARSFDLSMKLRLEQLASKWHEMAERAERSER